MEYIMAFGSITKAEITYHTVGMSLAIARFFPKVAPQRALALTGK
ncbi:hypothetical protein [Nostoc sp.]